MSFNSCNCNNWTDLTPDEFEKAYIADKTVTIDVRTADEFTQGHLYHAINIDWQKDGFMDEIKENFNTTLTLAIYCRSGKRSAAAAQALTDPRLDAYGTIDELNSFIGLMLSVMDGKAESAENIRWIQQKLFNIGGCLATDTTSFQLPDSCKILAPDVERIEHMIDTLTDGLPEQRSFILPGGTGKGGVPACVPGT